MAWKTKADNKPVQVVPPAPTPQEIKQAVTQQGPRWKVGDKASAWTPVVENTETGEQLDLYEAIAEILNRTE